MKIKILAVIMAIVMLAGCTAPAESPAEPRDVNITVIVDNLGDMSYNDGIVQELRASVKRYDDSAEFNLTLNVFEMRSGTDHEKAEMEEAFNNDSELIIIANQIALPVLEPAAAYFPQKNFVLIDTEATGANIHSALFNPNEASYLCGALAAEMSETGVIGIVIGLDIPALHDFVVGYIQGAVSIKEDIKVIVSTVGNFYDAEVGYELAEAQNEQGADIIFSVAGGAGLGCIKAATALDFYVIGVDIDQTEHVDVELRDKILTSCLKNFDMLIAAMLDEYLAGDLIFGGAKRFGLKEGAVGIARNQYYNNLVPEEIRDKIDAIEEDISAGTVKVRSAYEMTQAEIDNMFKSVRP